MTRIAIVVGHNPTAQGAVRVTDGRSEFDWCGELAEEIRARAKRGEVRLFYRQPGLGYKREIAQVYGEVDHWGAAVSVELHFNALNARATGTETLTSGTKGSLHLCRALQRHMVDCLGLADRGLKHRRASDRGGPSLWYGKAPAALVEPYFGSNARDCAVADAHMSGLADAILAGAREGARP